MSTNLAKLCKMASEDKPLYTSHYQPCIRYLRQLNSSQLMHRGSLDDALYKHAAGYIRYFTTLLANQVSPLSQSEEDFAIKRMIEIATKTELYDKR